MNFFRFFKCFRPSENIIYRNWELVHDKKVPKPKFWTSSPLPTPLLPYRRPFSIYIFSEDLKLLKNLKKFMKLKSPARTCKARKTCLNQINNQLLTKLVKNLIAKVQGIIGQKYAEIANGGKSESNLTFGPSK
uniref:Uncharacterized protein n=1 Tax=Trichogramma kaykai TaxID=54128 RepID=A0ABD2X2F1_9HYME